MVQPIDHIEVRGGNVNNLKNIDVDIPLNKFVAISGPSGSGKSSLAMGILYAEGSRRYLDALSTYTRRRIAQNKKSQVQSVKHIPSALALRQRPNIPSERSTVGSLTEAFNVIRLIFSRLAQSSVPMVTEFRPPSKLPKQWISWVMKWARSPVPLVAFVSWQLAPKTSRLIPLVPAPPVTV